METPWPNYLPQWVSEEEEEHTVLVKLNSIETSTLTKFPLSNFSRRMSLEFCLVQCVIQIFFSWFLVVQFTIVSTSTCMTYLQLSCFSLGSSAIVEEQTLFEPHFYHLLHFQNDFQKSLRKKQQFPRDFPSLPLLHVWQPCLIASFWCISTPYHSATGKRLFGLGVSMVTKINQCAYLIIIVCLPGRYSCKNWRKYLTTKGYNT